MNDIVDFTRGDVAVAEVYLLPGALQVARVPTRCTTILGSCVAVCLYDLHAGVGGINHFLLPGAMPDGEAEPLRWSGPACLALYDALLDAGAHRARLQAKLFGGASINPRQVHDHLRIGDRNVEAAQAAMQHLGIPVVSSDLGGSAGRKLIFEFQTGKAWVRTLAHRAG